MKRFMTSRLMTACGLGVALCLATVGCHFSVSYGEKTMEKTPAGAYKQETEVGQPTTSTHTTAPAPTEQSKSGVVQTGYYPVNAPTAGAPLGRANGNSPTGACPPGGCATGDCGVGPDGAPGTGPCCQLPSELKMTIHPPYVIEPPDTLKIEAVHLIPRPPYRIEPTDQLVVQVAEALPRQPIDGTFTVTPNGTINLGYSYGTVRVMGLTPDQARMAIEAKLAKKIKTPQVTVALAQFRGAQQTRGIYLVSQDGTITLGSYGSICIAGLTVAHAKAALERHLSQWFLNPKISLEVVGYNSKVYYAVFDGGGFGQQIYRMPITGNDTVLGAIANLGGLPPVSSKRRMWLARPSPCEKGCYQILPIDWDVITQAGDTCTNYQLFPGDRIYVKADPFIEFDQKLQKVFAPIERILGITLLGTSTVRSFQNNNNNGNSALLVGGF